MHVTLDPRITAIKSRHVIRNIIERIATPGKKVVLINGFKRFIRHDSTMDKRTFSGAINYDLILKCVLPKQL